MYPLYNGDKMKKIVYSLIAAMELGGCATVSCPTSCTLPSVPNNKPTLEYRTSLDGLHFTTEKVVYDIATASKTPGRCELTEKTVGPSVGKSHGQSNLACDTDDDGKKDYFATTRSGLGEKMPYREVFREMGDAGTKTSPYCVVRERETSLKCNPNLTAAPAKIPRRVPCTAVIETSLL